jgi:hypothetical protein
MASTNGHPTTSVTLHATISSHGAVVADALAIGSVMDETLLAPAEGAAAVAVRVLRAGTAQSVHPATSCCVAILTGLLLLLGSGRMLVRRDGGVQGSTGACIHLAATDAGEAPGRGRSIGAHLFTRTCSDLPCSRGRSTITAVVASPSRVTVTRRCSLMSSTVDL